MILEGNIITGLIFRQNLGSSVQNSEIGNADENNGYKWKDDGLVTDPTLSPTAKKVVLLMIQISYYYWVHLTITAQILLLINP